MIDRVQAAESQIVATSEDAVSVTVVPAQRANVQGPSDIMAAPPIVETPGSIDALGRARKIAYGVVFGLLAVSLLGLAIVHLGHSAPSAHSTDASSKTPKHAPAHAATSTTTSTTLPVALKPGAEAAATALVSGWASGNRAAALTVATPAAVSALFAIPYSSGSAVDRGCSTSFSPIVCTFGPPGGASPKDPIFQIYVDQATGGWYVSSMKVEN